MAFFTTGHDPQRSITHLLDTDVIIIAITEPEDVLQPDTRAVLQTILSSNSFADVHIVLNNVLCEVKVGKRALETSLSRALGIVLDPRSNAELQIHMVSSEAAIDAQAEFRRNQLQDAIQPSSSFSSFVDRFQRNVQNSGLPRLSQRLQSSLAGFRGVQTSPSPAVRSSMRTAAAAAHRAQIALGVAANEVDNERTQASALLSQTYSHTRELNGELFGSGELVATSTLASKRMVESYLANMSWWNLPWRVDGLASDVTAILNTSYGRTLERNVCFLFAKLDVVPLIVPISLFIIQAKSLPSKNHKMLLLLKPFRSRLLHPSTRRS